jgi:hypothetical protein
MLLAALILGARFDSGRQEGAGTDPAQTGYSTYSTGDQGLKGIYSLLEARGAGVSRWRRPVSSLGPDMNRLVIWQPAELTAGELGTLATWVKAGGTLVLSLPPGQALEQLVPAGNTSAARPPIPVPELLPAGVSPLLQGVQRLEGKEGLYFGRLPDRAGSTAYLVNSGRLPVAVGWTLGNGRVYAVAEPSILTNGLILRADNATFAVNLLDPGPGATVAFDEFHHGARVGEDWWQTLRPQMRWTILQAALAALVALLLAGARLGAPVELPEGISREAAEFARGLGNLLRETRANRWVLDRLCRSFRRDLARYLGAAPGVAGEELGRLWELHTGEPAGPLVELLGRCTAGGPPSDRSLMAALSGMAEYRRRIHTL